MSQADTQLAPEGDDDIASIAASMGDEPEQVEQEEEQEQDEGSEEVAEVEEQPNDDDPLWEVELDGKPRQIKRSEIPGLLKGGMLESDYRRKTAEVAEQRRALEQEAQAIQQKRQQDANQLDVFIASLHRELLGSQPSLELLDSDPQEYLRQERAHNVRAQQFQGALQYRQALTAQQEQEAQRKQTETVQRENEKLLEAMPELRDEKARTEAFSGVAKFLQSAGYTAEEMNGLTDHRAVMVAIKAAKYDALQAAKAKQAKPEVPKPVKPGATQGNQPNTRLQRAHERLKRDPNDLDALSAVVGG